MLMMICVSHSNDIMEEEEDDTIHMGNAIMTFYAALIDLLGRCAPEMHVSVGMFSLHRHMYIRLHVDHVSPF